MADIACPGCGKTVDSEINSCVYCHARIRGNPDVKIDRLAQVVSQLRILVVLAVLILLGLIVIILRT